MNQRHVVVLNFSKTLPASGNANVPGAGGLAVTDGYPMPYPGKMLRMDVWDDTGSNLLSDATPSSAAAAAFVAGDRIGCQHQFVSPEMYVYGVKLDSGGTSAVFSTVPGPSIDILVTITVELYIDL